MSDNAAKRRVLTTLQKLHVLVRHSRCPRCGEKFGALDEIDFDHYGQLALTGDNSIENFRPLHRIECHPAKTASDAAARAKVRRLAPEHEDMRRRMLAKSGQGDAEPKRKSRLQGRPFRKRDRA